MPDWVDAIAARLTFFGEDVPDGEPSLEPFLAACLDLVEEAAGREALSPVREVLPALCALARAAGGDDRAVNAAAAAWRGVPGVAGYAASVPGRVVWLAAMVAQVPDEQGAAAAMLVNDLACVDAAFPARAWRAAVR